MPVVIDADAREVEQDDIDRIFRALESFAEQVESVIVSCKRGAKVRPVAGLRVSYEPETDGDSIKHWLECANKVVEIAVQHSGGRRAKYTAQLVGRGPRASERPRLGNAIEFEVELDAGPMTMQGEAIAVIREQREHIRGLYGTLDKLVGTIGSMADRDTDRAKRVAEIYTSAETARYEHEERMATRHAELTVALEDVQGRNKSRAAWVSLGEKFISAVDPVLAALIAQIMMQSGKAATPTPEDVDAVLADIPQLAELFKQTIIAEGDRRRELIAACAAAWSQLTAEQQGRIWQRLQGLPVIRRAIVMAWIKREGIAAG